MKSFRRLVHVAVASTLLPGILFVFLALSLIHSNLEEVRSLPNTYWLIVKGFVAVWAFCAIANIVALRGRLRWGPRLLTGISVCIFFFDMFHSIWLSSWLLVIIAALVEIAIVVVVAWIVSRMELQSLLDYAALCSVLIIGGTVAIHVYTTGPHLVWNVFKEMIRPSTEASTLVHANPWKDLPKEATEIPGAFDPAIVSSLHSEVEIQKGETLRITNSAPPGALIASFPLQLFTPPGAPAVVQVRLRLIQGNVGFGIKAPVSSEWFFRAPALESDGERHVLNIPIYRGAKEVELLAYNGRIGRERYTVEVEEITVYQLPVKNGDPPVSRGGNVYQILLDAAELATFLEVTEDHPELRYDGFTVYTDFHTCQSKTLWSLPTIINGAYYDPKTGENANRWRDRAYQDGVFSDLQSNGVPVHEYPWVASQCYQGAEYRYSHQDYRDQLLSQVSDNFILDLAFLRTLPNSLRSLLIGSVNQERPPPDSWDYGFSLTAKLWGRSKDTSEDEILKEFYYSLNLFTVNFFREMLVDEVKRRDEGQFVFYHSLVPHAPYARDADCCFVPKAMRTSENTYQRKLDQNVCALRIVGWLVEQLKLLGRYDNALIIVHADHGQIRFPKGVKYFDERHLHSAEWPSWLVDSRSAGLLMIKWPHAKGFETSTLPTQTIDIAPTILRHFNLKIPGHYMGTAIQKMPPDFQREMVFFATKDNLVGADATSFSKYVRQSDGSWKYQEEIDAEP